MTPAEKSTVVQQALMDAARHGKPGDVDRLLAKLKADPGFVEELAKETKEEKSGDRPS